MGSTGQGKIVSPSQDLVTLQVPGAITQAYFERRKEASFIPSQGMIYVTCLQLGLSFMVHKMGVNSAFRVRRMNG